MLTVSVLFGKGVVVGEGFTTKIGPGQGGAPILQ